MINHFFACFELSHLSDKDKDDREGTNKEQKKNDVILFKWKEQREKVNEYKNDEEQNNEQEHRARTRVIINR